jgi:hypothetical protein
LIGDDPKWDPRRLAYFHVVVKFTSGMGGMMSYKVQVIHAEAGFFLDTNRESGYLEELKVLGIFDGFRFRIVDESGDDVLLD